MNMCLNHRTVQLSANVLPGDAATKTVQWSSSDESVATVTSTGLVTAVKVGVATITATTDDGSFTDTCMVTVYIPSIAITQNGNELNNTLRIRLPWYKAYKNVSLNLGYIANTEDYARVEWSSNNEKVIVDQNGQVTNSKANSRSANITVKMYDANGKVIATDTVNLSFYKLGWNLLKLMFSLLEDVIVYKIITWN